ncbi:MerR family transcriptional regulator [Actinokineospora xionganensis]|uniref:MerR family transcriptional regulator n=1 Tax=Actinokineospora xionganensis TaxID=2684470 RepID=A0ABR7L3Q8_9PSEU|nr:MerR family transcriptional regulator [Actinokineospora xionganensis]MBC6447329.1 MerR family transcriptional regulator [Actinokineospora xionganensis]
MTNQAAEGEGVNGLGRLDDPEYPAFTIGQASNLLTVQQAFLRSLDAAGIVSPQRSGGGHRRYSRRQLETITRLRELLDQGHPLAAAARIVGLQNDLAAANAEISDLRDQLRERDGTP